MKHIHRSNKDSEILSWISRIGLLIVLLMCVAISVALVIWSQTTPALSFSRLINGKNISEIQEILVAEGISYRIDADTGTITAPIDPADGISPQGLSGRTGTNKPLAADTGFGAGKNTEMMRLRHNMESEVAHSIMTIQDIKSAKVILALPEQSPGRKESDKPSASVMVNLDKGKKLDRKQVDAIINLVASSVSNLDAEQVTLVDQRAQLLSRNDTDPELDLPARQLEYKKNLEEQMVEKIVNILSPLIDAESLRPQVSAELDFSGNKLSQQKDNSGLNNSKKQRFLANSARDLKTSPRRTVRKNADKNKAVDSENNFEGLLRRLSVAVVIDDQKTIQADGSVISRPYDQNEIGRFSDLVKQAIGFDNSRGDQLTVTNIAFKKPTDRQAATELPFWKQAWFFIILKQSAAGFAILLLFFGVVRPLIRNSVSRDGDVRNKKTLDLKKSTLKNTAMGWGIRYGQKGDQDGPLQDIAVMPNDVTAILLLDTPQSYLQRLEYLKKLTDADAKLVADVIKAWVKKDG